MSETDKMEVDDAGLHNLSVYFLPGLSKGKGLIHIREIDFKKVKTFKLKMMVIEEDHKRVSLADQENGMATYKDIDLLYNGTVLHMGNTLEAEKVKPGAIIHVVKNFTRSEASGTSTEMPMNEKPSTELIRQLAMALRTAFLSPAFLKTVEKLKEPEMLQNIFAVAPGLESDLQGIGILQNPHLIFQLSEREVLSRLAETRPWVLQALHHIAAAVHADKGSKQGRVPANLMLSQLLNTAFDGDDEEDMDEDEDLEPSRTQSQPNLHGPITREQLTQALNAVPTLGRGLTGGRGNLAPGSPGSPYGNIFSPVPGPSARPVTAPPANLTGGSSPNFQHLLQNALASLAQQQNSSGETTAAGSGLAPESPVPTLTGDMVARAMQEAFSQMPPEVRDRQYDMLRQLALQVAGGNPSPANTSVSAPAPVSAMYDQQLRQMRELGITDERLSILALRVSDGDVQTAAELIFSGWTGEGAGTETNS